MPLDQLKRREFMMLLGSAAAAWPVAAQGQQAKQVRRLGVLLAFDQSDPMVQGWVVAFKDELRRLGWTEGHNLQIEYRWPSSDTQAMQKFAKELVALHPDAILSSSTPPTKALMQHTSTIPIVFANLVDPVGSGLVASLARPGGNVTGFVNLDATMAGKWLELIKEVAPRIARVAVPFNPITAPYAQIYLDPFKSAGAALGVEIVAAPVKNVTELEAFIASQASMQNVGVIPVPDGFINANRGKLATQANYHRMPSVHFNRAFVKDGGLLSYGNDTNDNYRRAAGYLDRIFRGDKAGELAVQFSVKFELALNLKTAKALGLDVPLLLQQRADEVIE